MADPRSCSVCVFDTFGGWDDEDHHDHAFNDSSAPHLTALRNKIRHELLESQRRFADEMDKRLAEAFNADRTLAVGGHSNVGSARAPLQNTQHKTSSWWSQERDDSRVQKGTYKYLGLRRAETEPTPLQQEWTENWLEEVEDGELDVYTCLGLSNCFSWTPDTRSICAKAIAVTFLQMVVPFCLLHAEFTGGIELGPAEGDLTFRLVGLTLYGYAIYSMYKGADGHCRTKLLNLMFQYNEIELGHILPLIIGEISNIFTAVVLVVALYSIFTTQTEPADLILNAVAVNFLCDCDGSFVDMEMRQEAVATFKTFTRELFTTQEARHDDPSTHTIATKLVQCALFVVSVAGVLGCTCFMLYPSHAAGARDTAPGFAHHVEYFNITNNTLTPIENALRL